MYLIPRTVLGRRKDSCLSPFDPKESAGSVGGSGRARGRRGWSTWTVQRPRGCASPTAPGRRRGRSAGGARNSVERVRMACATYAAAVWVASHGTADWKQLLGGLGVVHITNLWWAVNELP